MNLRVLLLCALVALLVSAPATAAPVEYSPGELPLGKPGLTETRTTQQLAPGVTYTRIVRGTQSGKDFYTVDVAFEADQSAAQGVANRLRSDGYKPRIEEISQRAPDDPRRGPLGYLVRVGVFAKEDKATAHKTRLETDGYSGSRVVYTGALIGSL